ncbi:MAG: lytic transglycosylase domain-containing protein [Acidimicrobiia bacterium]
MMQTQGLQRAQARIAALTQRFVPAPKSMAFAGILSQVDKGLTPQAQSNSHNVHLSRGQQEWISSIEGTAARVGVDPQLLTALVWAESSFDPTAESHAGAIGLTQLMPATAAELGVDPYDPQQNLEGGATYLRQMLDRFGDVPTALAAYNAGPGRVSQAGGIPDIPETKQYVERVLTYYGQLGGNT